MSIELVYLTWGRPQRPRANMVHSVKMATAFSRLGFDVSMYVPSLPRNFDVDAFLHDMGSDGGFRIHDSAVFSRRWHGTLFSALYRRVLMRADCVFTPSAKLGLTLARFKIPCVVEIHDAGSLEDSGDIPSLVKQSGAGKPIRAFICVSAEGAKTLLTAGAAQSCVHVFRNAVDLDEYRTVPALDLDRMASMRAVCVGRMSRDRGLEILVAIANSGICPVIHVGPRDDEPDGEVNGLLLCPAVPHRQVINNYSSAEIVLLPYQPTLRNAVSMSPMKLFEAMAAGRCIVASDLPTIRELIRDGENGLLVAPDKPQEWIEAIGRLHSNPEWALQLASQARKDVSVHTWLNRAQGISAMLGFGDLWK